MALPKMPNPNDPSTWSPEARRQAGIPEAALSPLTRLRVTLADLHDAVRVEIALAQQEGYAEQSPALSLALGQYAGAAKVLAGTRERLAREAAMTPLPLDVTQ